MSETANETYSRVHKLCKQLGKQTKASQEASIGFPPCSLILPDGVE